MQREPRCTKNAGTGLEGDPGEEVQGHDRLESLEACGTRSDRAGFFR